MNGFKMCSKFLKAGKASEGGFLDLPPLNKDWDYRKYHWTGNQASANRSAAYIVTCGRNTWLIIQENDWAPPHWLWNSHSSSRLSSGGWFHSWHIPSLCVGQHSKKTNTHVALRVNIQQCMGDGIAHISFCMANVLAHAVLLKFTSLWKSKKDHFMKRNYTTTKLFLHCWK